MYSRSVSPYDAPDTPEEISIDFKSGDACAINNTPMSPFEILKKLNELGGKHGIGRIDLVENRYIGMKSRGVYETPGGTIYYHAHRAIESLTLDKEAAVSNASAAFSNENVCVTGAFIFPSSCHCASCCIFAR